MKPFKKDKHGNPVMTFTIRTSSDGWVRGGVQMDEDVITLVRIPLPPYEASQGVRDAFLALVKELAAQALREAFGEDCIRSVTVVPVTAGVPDDEHPKH